MKRIMVFMKKLLLLSAVAIAINACASKPDWIKNVPPQNNGFIYFVGYSGKMQHPSMTLLDAQLNALHELIRKIQNNEITEFYPIPADAKFRSAFSYFSNGKKVGVVISDILIVKAWTDDAGGRYVLCSCTGIEINSPI